MFNSNIIDVAIGLVFVFLTLSLICSAANEGLETFFKQRAKNLEKGIRELLGDPQAQPDSAAKPADAAGQNPPPADQADGTKAGDGNTEDFVALLYNHGLINALYRGKYGETPLSKLPSYIPAANFALAVLDLRNKPNIILPKNLRSALAAFEMKAKGDLTTLQRDLEGWYDSAMDRVSGWYKRRVQIILAVLALAATIAVNADTVYIARRLSTDSNLRQSVARIAEETAKHPPQNQTSQGNSANTSDQGDSSATPSQSQASQTGSSATQTDPVARIRTNLQTLDGIGLPLGWQDFVADFRAERAARTTVLQKQGKAPEKESRLAVYFEAGVEATKLHGIGWIITALAVSLGAPFWFDVLNKIIVVRSTVKPSEKSGDEASKDPRPSSAPPPSLDAQNPAPDQPGGN